MRRHHLVVWIVMMGACGPSAPEPTSTREPPPPAEAGLPAPGTHLAALPEGEGRDIAEAGCLACHSADMLRQQRLTSEQWAANVDKMIGWGADIPEQDKAALVAYLALHFGRDNAGFEPLVVAPIAAEVR